MIVRTLCLPELDLATIMRAFRDRKLARLIVRPEEYGKIALKIECYSYELKSFLVETNGQTLLLNRNEDTWYLTPIMPVTMTKSASHSHFL